MIHEELTMVNDQLTTLQSVVTSQYHFYWKGGGGHFVTHPIPLNPGSYTFTWSLHSEGEEPFFQAELRDSHRLLITSLPPEVDGDCVGYHTMTVTIATSLTYLLQIEARDVTWSMGVMGLPHSPR